MSATHSQAMPRHGCEVRLCSPSQAQRHMHVRKQAMHGKCAWVAAQQVQRPGIVCRTRVR